MTRRRFYAPPIAFAQDGQSVTLSADETRHLRDVLRLRVDDEAYVFNGEGREFRGSVSHTDRSSTILRLIEETRPVSAESPLDLTLAVALLKGEKFDVVVQKATELGVSQIVPLITSRADVRIYNPEDAHKKQTRWQRIALEATKQCGRAKLMKIAAPQLFNEFVAHSPPIAAARIMFSERDGFALADAIDVSEKPASIAAIVGAEGGWTDEEIDQARSSDWKIVTLGGRILRAETAAIAVTALMQHRFGDLS